MRSAALRRLAKQALVGVSVMAGLVIVIGLVIGGGDRRWSVSAAHAEVLRPAPRLRPPSTIEKTVQAIAAATPQAEPALAPAAPFILKAASPAERERAVECLTKAVYYEAALEPTDGQRAVAQVVLNRVRDHDFPPSVCGVVYEGWERPTGCQFSFTCDGSLLRPPVPSLWAASRKVAEAALNGYVMAAVGAATHYHALSVNPWWKPTVVRIGQIGSHIFYRWPGAAGLPGAFTQRYAGDELKLSEAVIDGRAPRPQAPNAPGATGSTPDGRVHAVIELSQAAPPVPGFSGRPRQPSAAEVAWVDGLLDKFQATHRMASAAPGGLAPASPGASSATGSVAAGAGKSAGD